MENESIGALYKSTDISEKELLLDILDNFNNSFNIQKAKGFKGSFQFMIICEGKEVAFTILISDSTFRIIHDSMDNKPFLKVQCNFEMFCNITLKNFNPFTDIAQGKIKLDKGIFSIARFAKFGSLFSYREIDLKLPTSIKHSSTWIQPKKILLVNGSPRKDASTKLMLEWFKEGLPSEITEVVDVSALKLGRCLHCYKCWTDHPGLCIIDDDAKVFQQKIDASDLIVFFVPLSVFTMPSDMKRLLERMFSQTTPYFYHNKTIKATAHPVHNHKQSQAFLQFLAWGFPEMKYGKILEDNFNLWASHSLKNNLGSIKRPGINLILGDPRMQFIRKRIKESIIEVAKSVYNKGVVPKDKKTIIEKENYVSRKDFYFYATHYWIKRFKTNYWN